MAFVKLIPTERWLVGRTDKSDGVRIVFNSCIILYQNERKLNGLSYFVINYIFIPYLALELGTAKFLYCFQLAQ